ncbi:hypothetical protein [Halovivax limisalsi]|uniref:hypothetical protein n=1 Tax=Halovivax limisalsi TaxID=1453760 RepID=UPI001FFCA16F|nr:hypothetical protein [Halovivax limisalsi]
MSDRPSSGGWFVNGGLAVGFLAITAALLVARATPATEYEPSIYAATPPATWAAIGLAFAVAIVAALSLRGAAQAVAIALGALATTTVISLPVVRGYYFLGKGDAMTHLGWVRDLLAGTMAPHELLYPGVHSVASLFVLIAGVEPPHALLLTVIVLFVSFVLVVPLAVRAITDDPLAIGTGAVVSWFVLPVNNVATYAGVHTNSNALFYAPAFVFALLVYLGRRSGDDRLPAALSPFGLLVVISGVGLLLLHPQQMVNAVVILATISAIQLLARYRFDDHPILEHPTTHAYTAVLGGAFVVWAFANPRFREAFEGLLYGLLSGAFGASGTVDQRGASLTEIGASLPELFAKLFLVSAVIGLAVGAYLLVVWTGRSRGPRETRAVVSYLGVSLLPLGGIFAVYFLGTPTMAFRQLGFIFVVVTVLAGLAVAGGAGRVEKHVPGSAVSGVLAVVLGLCLVVALLGVFSSPFIYNPTQHVSEATYHGYETAITGGVDDRPYAGYGYTTTRYNHAINGVESMNATEAGIAWPGDGTIEMDAFNRRAYHEAYPGDGPYFLALSSYDRVREHDVYRGLNYDPESLSALPADRGSARYVSNAEFELYEIRDR